MPPMPPPVIACHKEDWPDADFELPDGDPIQASDVESDKENDREDWDIEMDLGATGGAKAQLSSTMFTIRPPIDTSLGDEDEDDEAAATIKVAALPKAPVTKAVPPPVDEDFEDAFALPEDLTQLSLRPQSLVHRSSKGSLEWGDNHTTSSQSSDAYSTLGFDANSPSSNYTSVSQPETETEEEDDEADDLDGLVFPIGLFESRASGRKLAQILETKKKTVFSDDRVKVASTDPEDDFEAGLVFDNDAELSPTRLLQAKQSGKRSSPPMIRSKSVPSRQPVVARPPSRPKTDHAKSPNTPPVACAAQLRRLSPPLQATRTYSQAAALPPPPPPPPSAFLPSKPGSLRVQKSHSGLKPSASPPQSRKLLRKASLPSLECSSAQASGSGAVAGPSSASAAAARYDAPTASSRAKSHASSSSKLHGLEYVVPPARPSTPSSNPIALRLTMPTSASRIKTRTPISSVFPTAAPVASGSNAAAGPSRRLTSPPPIPSRPSSAASIKSRPTHAQTRSAPTISAPKVLRKPKRQRTYGDGTELDGIEDLPLDREKEGRYRVQPKGVGNRVPGATYAKVTAAAPADGSMAALGKGTVRRKTKRELSEGTFEQTKAAAPPAKTLKRTGRIEFASKGTDAMTIDTRSSEGHASRKKTSSSVSPTQTRRKPTLIRNLGGVSAPKVVGEMKWNPTTLRWEGNDQVLRDFDAAVGSSTRPALITHLSGSSVGSSVGSIAAGARVVGNMIFDPARMCWISRLAPDEDEPDVFADLADDEDDDWDANTGTIRASLPRPPQAGLPRPTRVQRRSASAESDRGSRASMMCDVDVGFAERCREAEARHRAELRGWLAAGSPTHSRSSSADADRAYLSEIRQLATRQY